MSFFIKHPNFQEFARVVKRDEVQKQTVEACISGGYSSINESIVFSPEFVKNTVRANVFYSDTPSLPQSLTASFCEPKIFVSSLDGVDCALNLKKQKNEDRILILNMANAVNPGGGWIRGARAQEEQLFRRSNYFQHLTEFGSKPLDPDRSWTYPIPEFGAIYSPNVIFFRHAEENSEELGGSYAGMSEPFLLDCIAVAAYVGPPTYHPSYPDAPPGCTEPSVCEFCDPLLHPQFAINTKHKIRTLLYTVAVQGNRHLVLSALGCGAFLNPPRHMARLFHEVLNEEVIFQEQEGEGGGGIAPSASSLPSTPPSALPFSVPFRVKNLFETIIFAVYLKGAAASRDNFEAFLDVFGDEAGAGVGCLRNCDCPQRYGNLMEKSKMNR